MNVRLALIAFSVFAVAPPCEASVTISTDATRHMSCSAGVCAPTAKKAVLNVTHLTGMLSRGDVKITTGAGAVTITIAAPFSWTSTSRLTLDAYYNVSFRAAVTVAGKGAVTITTNDGGSGGELSFFDSAKLDFWDTSSSLVINNRNYSLVSDVHTLAAGVSRHPKGSFALANDYDASADGVYTDVPVLTPFAGRFDGLGHTIANLTITYSAKTDNTKVGMFATISPRGLLRNLVLRNSQITLNKKSFYGHLGTLAGDSAGRLRGISVVGGRISGSTAGTRRSSVCAGGLVSYNAGTIIASQVSQMQIYSPHEAGGIACSNQGAIIQSTFNATVGAGTGGWAGGIAYGNSGSISLSSSAGNVAVSPDRYGSDGSEGAGGLVAYNEGTIDRSYSIAMIDAGASAAGEVNESYPFGGGVVAENDGTVTNSYALGSIEAYDRYGIGVFVGGIQGDTGYYGNGTGSVATTYFAGALDCSECRDGPGGFAGDSRGTYNADYWNTDTSGTETACGWGNTCAGIAGLTDAQLRAGLPAGFDPAIWGQSPSINNGYPYLLANPPPQ